MLKSFFLNTEIKKLLLYVLILGITADLSNSLFLQKYFMDIFIAKDQIMSLLLMQGYSPEFLNEDLLNEAKFMLARTFEVFLFCFSLYHTLLYILAFKNKKWPAKYLKGYSVTAFIFSVITLHTFFEYGLFLGLIFTVITFFYLFNYLALKSILNRI